MTGPRPLPHVWFPWRHCAVVPGGGWTPEETQSAPDKTSDSPGGGREGGIDGQYNKKRPII